MEDFWNEITTTSVNDNNASDNNDDDDNVDNDEDQKSFVDIKEKQCEIETALNETKCPIKVSKTKQSANNLVFYDVDFT